MARPTKKYRSLNCKVDEDIILKLEKFTRETRMTKTATVEKALEMYLKHYDETKQL